MLFQNTYTQSQAFSSALAFRALRTHFERSLKAFLSSVQQATRLRCLFLGPPRLLLHWKEVAPAVQTHGVQICLTLRGPLFFAKDSDVCRMHRLQVLLPMKFAARNLASLRPFTSVLKTRSIVLGPDNPESSEIAIAEISRFFVRDF